MKSINQRSSTNIHGLLRILFQYSRLPGVLSELALSVDVCGRLDSAVDPLRMSDSALPSVRSLRFEWPTAAHLILSALLNRRTTEISLTLKSISKSLQIDQFFAGS